jgi:hypothetical protein
VCKVKLYFCLDLRTCRCYHRVWEHYQCYIVNYLTHGKNGWKTFIYSSPYSEALVHTLYFLSIPSSPSCPLRLSLGTRTNFWLILLYTFHGEPCDWSITFLECAYGVWGLDPIHCKLALRMYMDADVPSTIDDALSMYCNKGHFSLWPLVKQVNDFSNVIGGEQKFVCSAFTLETKGQRTTPSKMPTWHHFLWVLATRVYLVEKSLSSGRKFIHNIYGNPNTS